MDVDLYKEGAPPQTFFKTIQSYFRTAYPNQLLECAMTNTFPKKS